MQPHRLSTQLDAVRHEDRRQILFALRDVERWRPSVSAFDDDRTPVGEPPIPAELYHCQLPKLAEMGLIEWDRETHWVTRGSEYERVRPLLAFLAEQYNE
ncbi:hypothetical protein [Haloarcula sp. CBA1130]|nr:hypothetical protein [Haloarcula sp. CBA1130]